MKISVSSYSYNQYISTGKMTQMDALIKAAEQGFDGIEFTELRPGNNKDASFEDQLAFAKELREKAKELDIEIVAYLIGANLYKGSREEDGKEVERVCRQLDVAAALGAKIFRHDIIYKEVVDGKTVSFDRQLPTIAENARRITEYAAKLGIRTCSENHGYVAQDSDRVEKLYNTVAHENYGLLIDMGNFACADEDSAKAVSRLAAYAIHAHAKDFVKYPFGSEIPADAKTFFTRGCNRLAGCAVGDGDIPVQQCVEILKRAGYDGYLTIEFEGSGECISEISKGQANLRSYI